MNPRDLGPCALQMQRLLVFFVVFVAIFITVLSGPQLAPPWSSPPDLMQWIIYSPNFIRLFIIEGVGVVCGVRRVVAG